MARNGDAAGLVIGVALLAAAAYYALKVLPKKAGTSNAQLANVLNSGQVATIFNAPSDMLIPGPNGAILIRGHVDPIVDDLAGLTL